MSSNNELKWKSNLDVKNVMLLIEEKQKYEGQNGTDENILYLTSWNIFTSIFQGSY